MAGGYSGNKPGNGLKRNSADPKTWEIDEAADLTWTGEHDFTGATVTGISGGSGAPTTSEYLVGASDGTLSAERVVTDTTTITWDLATAGQAKADVNTLVIQATSEKGNANGYAELDASALVPTDQLGTGTANSTKFLRGDQTWQTPVGSGVISKWAPWVPPGSIHALGDEFDDSSLDAKWSEWDPSGSDLLAVSEDPQGLVLAHTDNPASTENLAGIYQALGADDEYEICTRVSLQGAPGNTLLAGILLLEDPGGAPATTDALIVQLRLGATARDVLATRYSDYVTAVSTTASGYAYHSVYLCLQYKASTGRYSAYFSPDGIAWLRFVSDALVGFTPTAVGLGVNAAQRDVTARNEFFRVRSGASGIHDVYPPPLGG